MNRISRKLETIAKSLISQENEEQFIQQLVQMSREFTTNDVSQIIPVNFYEATTQGIENMLNKYYSFLGQKQSKLQQLQRYLNRLIQNVIMAKKYLEQNKSTANQLIDKCSRLKKILSKNPKIRTKNTPKSKAFFRKKDLIQ